MEKTMEMKRIGKWFVGFSLFFCTLIGILGIIDNVPVTLTLGMGILMGAVATIARYISNGTKEKDVNQRAEEYAKTNENPKSRKERGLPHDARTFHILNHLELETKRNELELTSMSDEEQKKTLGYLLDMYFQKQDHWTK